VTASLHFHGLADFPPSAIQFPVNPFSGRNVRIADQLDTIRRRCALTSGNEIPQ